MTIDKTIALTILGLLGFVFFTRETKEGYGGLPNFTTKIINSPYTIPSKFSPRFDDNNGQILYTPDQTHSYTSGNVISGGTMYKLPGGRPGSMPSGRNPMDDRTLDLGPMAQGYVSKEGYFEDINRTGFGGQTEVSDMMPGSGQGGNKMLNPQGEPIIYDRVIFANQKSKLAAQGDPIRGDLPILPHKNGWFNPSSRPNIDLRDGALAVMGGVSNSTNQKLLMLQHAASGGYDTTFGGVDLKRSGLMNGQQDLIM